MIHHKLTLITILLLALSLNGMAQSREVKLEIKTTVPKAEPVKVEQINNQDILRVASQADTIRIPLTDDTWAQIENLVQSNVGTGLTLKAIEGADVHLLRVTKNMKPGIYSRKRNRTSISLSDEKFGIIRLKEKIPFGLSNIFLLPRWSYNDA